MFGLLIPPMVIAAQGYINKQRRANRKPPPEVKPPVKGRVVPDDYVDRINALFKKLQTEVEEYGEGADPDYVVERLKMRISRTIEAFPIVEDPKKTVPDNYAEIITSDFVQTYLRAAEKPKVNLNLVITHLHEDILFHISRWK